MKQWRAIPGYEQFYEISEDGLVRSFGRERKLRKGGTSRTQPKFITSKIRRKYFCVQLIDANRNVTTLSNHRLVALSFIPNPQNYPIVNHIDGNRHNNHYSNLEWCTQSHNVQHALKYNLFPLGDKRRTTKLTDEQVTEIRLLKSKMSGTQVAEMYKVNNSSIYRIWNNQKRKHYDMQSM